MVNTLASDRPNHPFHEAILPRATIAADVKRFFHQIKTDEVFGTHR